MTNPWLSPDDVTALLEAGTGRGVRVAIIDSGVELTHARLAGLTLRDDVRIVEQNGMLATVANDGVDDFGHGSAVAGIIRDLAPEVELGSFHVLDGTNSTRSRMIIEAVRLALDAGYHVLNCSFGCGDLDQVLDYKTWVDEAYLRGVHVVAACNNENYMRPEWPGHFGTVLTVNMARTNEAFRFWYKSGTLVEFAAMGVNVDVVWRGGRTKNMSGSSFAAPRVTGLLARLLSLRPDITPVQAKALFHRVADPWRSELRGPNVIWTA